MSDCLYCISKFSPSAMRNCTMRSSGSYVVVFLSRYCDTSVAFGIRTALEVHRVWQERKVAVEAAVSDDAAPEFRRAQRFLSLSGILPKQFSGCGIEVG